MLCRDTAVLVAMAASLANIRFSNSWCIFDSLCLEVEGISGTRRRRGRTHATHADHAIHAQS